MHVLKRPSLVSPTGTTFPQAENGFSAEEMVLGFQNEMMVLFGKNLCVSMFYRRAQEDDFRQYPAIHTQKIAGEPMTQNIKMKKVPCSLKRLIVYLTNETVTDLLSLCSSMWTDSFTGIIRGWWGWAVLVKLFELLSMGIGVVSKEIITAIPVPVPTESLCDARTRSM